MKPQSLAARLLALTPQGRRLFELLGNLHQDAERLRDELAAARAAAQAQAEAHAAERAQLEGEAQSRAAAAPPAGDTARAEGEALKRQLAVFEDLLTIQEGECAMLRLELDAARAQAGGPA